MNWEPMSLQKNWPIGMTHLNKTQPKQINIATPEARNIPKTSTQKKIRISRKSWVSTTRHQAWLCRKERSRCQAAKYQRELQRRFSRESKSVEWQTDRLLLENRHFTDTKVESPAQVLRTIVDRTDFKQLSEL